MLVTTRRLILIAWLAAASGLLASLGPSRGALVIIGGGTVGPEIIQRFIALAGGPDSPAVYIPTAADGDPHPDPADTLLAKAGMKNVTVLYTRDRQVANSEAFVAPLRKARAVFFEGGRQWRLADSYLNTLTEKELFRLLERGGVIGGSSAGATIQGEYLVRGAPSGNTIMMSPGHERGLGFLRGSAIDQHVLTRHREQDLWEVIQSHPKLLGIAIDEGTAIVVQKNQFEVIGKSKVLITDAHHPPQADGRHYYELSAPDRFDLRRRTKITNYTM